MAQRGNDASSDAGRPEVDGYAVTSLVIGATSLLSLDALLAIILPAGFILSATIFLIPITGLITSVVARSRLKESVDLRGRAQGRPGRQLAIAGGLLSGLALLVLAVAEMSFDGFTRIVG